MRFWKKDDRGVTSMLKNSFEKVKRDTQSIIEWLHLFHRRSEEHTIRLELVERQLNKLSINSHHPQDLSLLQSKLHSIVQIQSDLLARMRDIENTSRTHHQPLRKDLTNLQEKISNLEIQYQKAISSKPLERIVVPREPESKTNIIAKKIAKNSKNYIKNSIFSLINRHGKIRALDLRESIVDDKKLCSKSTFYRILEELEEHDEIGLLKQAKEKIYFSKIVEKNQFSRR
jgi:hypothetical protein